MTDFERKITVTITRNGDNIRVSVFNTGKNIPQEDINNISKLEQILANIDSQIIAIYNKALQLSYDKNKVKTYNPNVK